MKRRDGESIEGVGQPDADGESAALRWAIELQVGYEVVGRPGAVRAVDTATSEGVCITHAMPTMRMAAARHTLAASTRSKRSARTRHAEASLDERHKSARAQPSYFPCQ